MTSFIKAQKLSFKYLNDESGKFVEVLKSVDLEIRKGDFVTILGHNGCGKSTLAKTFNAILTPSSGKVYVSGIDTSDEVNTYCIRKKVGLVLQNPENQIVAGVVEEDVAFGPENLGVDPDEIKKRVEESLRTVGMYEYRKYSPYKLSGGQKQRVAIAGILAMHPECIVLDEPTSMLDPEGRKEVISTIKKLNERFGITVILITHFMDEAILSDKIIIMSNGKIVNEGTPREIFSNPGLLKKNHLNLPQATELIEKLCDNGFNLPRPVLDYDECILVLKNFLQCNANAKFPKNESNQINHESKKSKIQLKNVSYYYGKGTQFECKALSNINFEVLEGSFVSLIGHTGSGKSTLIQHLNGLFKPHEGEVLFEGANINLSREKSKEMRYKIGLVFQYPEHQLFEETVYRDIAFGPQNMKLSKLEIERRIIMASEFVGLDPNLLNKSPFDLSGGEKRKAAIAGVIAMDPEVLILDEPTAGLDPEGRESLLMKIKRYHQTKRNTIIMVSHNMEDIAKVSDKVLVMDNGVVKMFGEVQDIFSQVEAIEKMGLCVPQITKITSELIYSGFALNHGIIDVDTAVNQIKFLAR